MKNYEEEKKDVEEFISGTVKELSEDNKQKAFWIYPRDDFRTTN